MDISCDHLASLCFLGYFLKTNFLPSRFSGDMNDVIFVKIRYIDRAKENYLFIRVSSSVLILVSCKVKLIDMLIE